MTSEAPLHAVDVGFSLSPGPGEEALIPADHGYALFSAIARVLPWVHSDRRVGVHPLSGRLVGGRRLLLLPTSRLILRVPADVVPATLSLAGTRLVVDGATAVVGVPSTRALRPSPTLVARIVTIKGMMAPDAFLDAVRKQLGAAGITGQPSLPTRVGRSGFDGGAGRFEGEPIRRTLRIREKTVVGYALRVEALSEADSFRLQAIGIGGRRRFGCGIFLPSAGSAR